MGLLRVVRIDGKPKHVLVQNFGRVEDLDNNIDPLQNIDFTGIDVIDRYQILSVINSNNIEPKDQKIIGPVLVFEKIWNNLKIDRIINSLSRDKNFPFSPERVIFACVLERLIKKESEDSLVDWIKAYQLEGAENIQPGHCQAALDWLSEAAELSGTAVGPFGQHRAPEGQSASKEAEGEAPKQAASKPARTVARVIARELFAKRRNLLTQISLAYFEGQAADFNGQGASEPERPKGDGQRGASLKEPMAIGVAMDNPGYPICVDIRPGLAGDAGAMAEMAKRLSAGFGIGRVCLVAHRQLMSKNVIDEISKLGWKYIFGQKVENYSVFSDIFEDDSPCIEVDKIRLVNEASNQVNQRKLANTGNRYLVYFDEEEAINTGHTRQEIIDNLEEALKDNKTKSCQILIKALRDFDASESKNIKKQAKYHGFYILITNTNFAASNIIFQYRQMLMIDKSIKEFIPSLYKNTLDYHGSKDVEGYYLINFLAFLLKNSLLSEIDKAKKEAAETIPWETLVNDLNSLWIGLVQSGVKRFQVRPRALPGATKAFRAVGLAIPMNSKRLANEPDPYGL
jgi:hypothetical protein